MKKLIPDIESYIVRNKYEIKKIVRLFYGEIRDKLLEERLVRELIRIGVTNNIEYVAQKISQEWVNSYFTPWITQQIESASLSIMKKIDKLFGGPSVQSIELLKPALDYIKKEAGELIVNMTRHQIEAIRNVISLASRNQWGYLKTMELLRPTVTLTELESKWVVNEYKRVYGAVIDSMREKLGASGAKKVAELKAQASAARKARYLENNRTERIARTEHSRAYNNGLLNSVQAGINKGKYSSAMKVWRRTNFTDNHPSSVGNDGVAVQLWEAFPTPDRFGNEMLYPSEIYEHCIIEIEMY